MRGIRILLALIAIINACAGYMFIFMPNWVARLYVLQGLLGIEHFFAMMTGALLFVLALGALIAILQPGTQKGIVIMITLAHFALFIVDIIVLSRGQMVLRQVLPEMLYHLVVVIGLIRFFPTRVAPLIVDTKEEAAPKLEIV